MSMHVQAHTAPQIDSRISRGRSWQVGNDLAGMELLTDTCRVVADFRLVSKEGFGG